MFAQEEIRTLLGKSKSEHMTICQVLHTPDEQFAVVVYKREILDYETKRYVETVCYSVSQVSKNGDQVELKYWDTYDQRPHLSNLCLSEDGELTVLVDGRKRTLFPRRTFDSLKKALELLAKARGDVSKINLAGEDFG